MSTPAITRMVFYSLPLTTVKCVYFHHLRDHGGLLWQSTWNSGQNIKVGRELFSLKKWIGYPRFSFGRLSEACQQAVPVGAKPLLEFHRRYQRERPWNQIFPTSRPAAAF